MPRIVVRRAKALRGSPQRPVLRSWDLRPRGRSRRPHRQAGVAQSVEQLIRNQQVVGSSPTAGSRHIKQLAGSPDSTPSLRGQIGDNR